MASGTINKMTAESGTGYCKMPDGTLIQWGTVTIPEDLYVATVTLPKSFADTNYSVTLGVYDTDISPGINYKYTGGIRFGRTPNTTSNRIDWQAVGRWE